MLDAARLSGLACGMKSELRFAGTGVPDEAVEFFAASAGFGGASAASDGPNGFWSGVAALVPDGKASGCPVRAPLPAEPADRPAAAPVGAGSLARALSGKAAGALMGMLSGGATDCRVAGGVAAAGIVNVAWASDFCCDDFWPSGFFVFAVSLLACVAAAALSANGAGPALAAGG